MEFGDSGFTTRFNEFIYTSQIKMYGSTSPSNNEVYEYIPAARLDKVKENTS
jgi:hypothetical protein